MVWTAPGPAELKEFNKRLTDARVLDPKIIDLLRSFPKSATPMEVLRTAVSALSFYDPDESDNEHDANVSKSFRLTSQIAMLVAAYDRLRKGKTVVEPDPALSHAANFLWMLNGEKPSVSKPDGSADGSGIWRNRCSSTCSR